VSNENINNLINNVRKHIASHGWQVLGVPSEDRPCFAYTIGLMETFGHPEIIMSGLDIELMQHLLNDIGDLIKNGETFNDGQLVGQIVENEKVRFKGINSVQVTEYLRLAEVYYEDTNVKAIQCQWSDESGYFPEEKQCSIEVNNQQGLFV